MITISLCMVVNNEAKSIVKCLESVKHIVDEIIIVDSGSTDQTKKMVHNYTDQIFHLDQNKDFSSARNYSLNKATKDYILWLDPDEVLLEEDQRKLLQLKQTLDPTIDTVLMRHHFHTDNYGNTNFSFQRNRMVKRTKMLQWKGAEYGYLERGENILESDIVITRKQFFQAFKQNLTNYEKKLAEGEEFQNYDWLQFGNELFEKQKLEMASEAYQRYLNGNADCEEDNIIACGNLAKIFYQLDDITKEREFILKSFQFDHPRPELCCRLGYSYIRDKKYKIAAFWYNLATNIENTSEESAFNYRSYRTWIPHVQLCICYYHLGDFEKSNFHNEKAFSYRPLNEHILSNRKLLEPLVKPIKTNTKSHIQIKDRFLRIVQVAPDFYPIPPKDYGGIEKVVYDLTEELVRRGHQVFVYALKDSQSSGTLIPYNHHGWRNEKAIIDRVLNTLPDNIDLIHDHTHFSIISKQNLSIPTVCTIHGPSFNDVKYPIYVSERSLEYYGRNYGLSVYNGINLDEYDFNEQKGEYLLFLGRISSVKGVHHVIEIAEKTKQRCIIAGPIHDKNDYYDILIKPHILNNPKIEIIGAVGGKQKQELLKNAKCMLFTSTWEEPFGLVMIEAMACGTPVIALGKGAVPEVMKGFPELICTTVDEMAEKVLNQPFPNPQDLRNYVNNEFSVSKMTDGYLEIYKKIINGEI